MSASHKVERPAELLAFLFALYPEVKRTKVRQWLKHRSVEVNGRPITRSKHPLEAGDSVSIRSKHEVRAESELPPGMKVLFEDAALIVIDKPEHLLSIASESERNETAYAYLTRYVRVGRLQSRERVWIVHRLDRETSGLMVFARTEAVKHCLQSHWTDAEKRYLAVVEGSPPSERGVLKSHLDESNLFKVYSIPRPSERTRLAVTRYRVLKQKATRALLELTPETGRRHQIRVQLAEAGCPIVGDPKYGARTNPARRLGLHASFLQFEHPSTGEPVRFDSALPRDLARAL